MANSKAQINSIQLNGELNLDKKQTELCNGDMFLEQNSPIYGGCITPTVYKRCILDTDRATKSYMYDKNGYWYRLNRSGSGSSISSNNPHWITKPALRWATNEVLQSDDEDDYGWLTGSFTDAEGNELKYYSATHVCYSYDKQHIMASFEAGNNVFFYLDKHGIYNHNSMLSISLSKNCGYKIYYRGGYFYIISTRNITDYSLPTDYNNEIRVTVYKIDPTRYDYKFQTDDSKLYDEEDIKTDDVVTTVSYQLSDTQNVEGYQAAYYTQTDLLTLYYNSRGNNKNNQSLFIFLCRENWLAQTGSKLLGQGEVLLLSKSNLLLGGKFDTDFTASHQRIYNGSNSYDYIRSDTGRFTFIDLDSNVCDFTLVSVDGDYLWYIVPTAYYNIGKYKYGWSQSVETSYGFEDPTGNINFQRKPMPLAVYPVRRSGDSTQPNYNRVDLYPLYSGSFYNYSKAGQGTLSTTRVYGVSNNTDTELNTFNYDPLISVHNKFFINWQHNNGILRIMIGGKGDNNICSNILYDSSHHYSYLLPGYTTTDTVPSTAEEWNNLTVAPNIYSKQGATAGFDYPDINRQGDFVKVFDSELNFVGISHHGVLMNEWGTINEDFEAITNYHDLWGSICIYKDTSGVLHKIKLHDIREEEATIDNFLTVVGNRYIILNSISNNAYSPVIDNAFDIDSNKYDHYAFAWNNQCYFGIKFWDVSFNLTDGKNYMQTCIGSLNVLKLNDNSSYKSKFHSIATVATGHSNNYQITNTFAPTNGSLVNTYSNIFVDKINTRNPYKTDIDLYVSYKENITPTYEYSAKCNVWNSNYEVMEYYNNADLTNIAYVSTATYNLPITGVKFLNSYTGKYGFTIFNNSYLAAMDGTKPILTYYITTLIENTQALFAIQSQYYGYINGYISSLDFTNNTISNIRSIISCEGMIFLGAFPTVAYFYSPINRSIYSFTGDADLKIAYHANSINEIINTYYIPSLEWIVVDTNKGTYMITQDNMFKINNPVLDDGNNTQLTLQGLTATQNGMYIGFKGSIYGTPINLWSYAGMDYDVVDAYPSIGDSPLYQTTIRPIQLKTGFLSTGSEVVSVIDCFYIRLFKDTFPDGKEIQLRTVSLNDVTQESKWVTIKPKFDEYGQALIKYQPQLQRGVGVSLEMKCDYPIISISYSINQQALSMTGQTR